MLCWYIARNFLLLIRKKPAPARRQESSASRSTYKASIPWLGISRLPPGEDPILIPSFSFETAPHLLSLPIRTFTSPRGERKAGEGEPLYIEGVADKDNSIRLLAPGTNESRRRECKPREVASILVSTSRDAEGGSTLYHGLALSVMNIPG